MSLTEYNICLTQTRKRKNFILQKAAGSKDIERDIDSV